MKKSKADKIWAYKIANPSATVSEVAKATKTSYTYVTLLMKKTGTPKEILEAPKPPKRGDILDTAKHTSLKIVHLITGTWKITLK